MPYIDTFFLNLLHPLEIFVIDAALFWAACFLLCGGIGLLRDAMNAIRNWRDGV